MQYGTLRYLLSSIGIEERWPPIAEIFTTHTHTSAKIERYFAWVKWYGFRVNYIHMNRCCHGCLYTYKQTPNIRTACADLWNFASGILFSLSFRLLICSVSSSTTPLPTLCLYSVCRRIERNSGGEILFGLKGERVRFDSMMCSFALSMKLFLNSWTFHLTEFPHTRWFYNFY